MQFTFSYFGYIIYFILVIKHNSEVSAIETMLGHQLKIGTYVYHEIYQLSHIFKVFKYFRRDSSLPSDSVDISLIKLLMTHFSTNLQKKKKKKMKRSIFLL